MTENKRIIFHRDEKVRWKYSAPILEVKSEDAEALIERWHYSKIISLTARLDAPIYKRWDLFKRQFVYATYFVHGENMFVIGNFLSPEVMVMVKERIKSGMDY